MSEVTLTTKQILNLCEFAGIHVDDEKSSFHHDKEELDTEFTIYDSDYGPLAVLTEYPEEGSYPLSDHSKNSSKTVG